jgi:hypothetical protein
MRVFSFHAVLLIARLVNFRSAGFTVNRMVISEKNSVDRGLPPLHRYLVSRSVASSRGNQLCMLQEDSTAVTDRDTNDDLSILTGQIRDRLTIYDACKSLLRDSTFLQTSNSLKLMTDALKRCATPADRMLNFWQKALSRGIIVKKRDVKDLLYYCYDYGRKDMYTIQRAVEAVCELDKATYWSSMLFNLIIQIYSDRLQLTHDNTRSEIFLLDIVRDIVNNSENLMDEKSLVMLLKYFGSTVDYEGAKLVFSLRNNVTKRPIENSSHEEGESAEIEVVHKENVVVWNAYLTALTKIALKDNNSGENQYSVEVNERLTTMIDLKIADFYTHCIILEFYNGKINANKKYNNNKRSEDIMNQSLEMWNNDYFLKLRESKKPYKNVDGIKRGLMISYAVMIRGLLRSADSAIGQKSLTTTNTYSDASSGSVEDKVRSKSAADKYVKIALQLAYEVPSAEVTSSLLYSLGLAEEKCEVAINYMNELIERSLSMSSNDDKSSSSSSSKSGNRCEGGGEKEVEGDGRGEKGKESRGESRGNGGGGSMGGSEESLSVEGVDSIDSSSSNSAQDKYTPKKYTKNRTKHSSQNNENSDPVNVVESLLGGYYASARNDLVVEAYLSVYDNLSKTANVNNRQFNGLKISKLNIQGSTKAFNLFLVSVKEMAKGGLIDERDKEQLWRFCKSVIKERMSAENSRVNGDRNGDEGSGEGGTGENIGYKGFTGDRGYKGYTGRKEGKVYHSGPTLFDSYSTVISMDLANMLTDYTMSKDLFYHFEATSAPSQRAVQTYLRAFQAPTQLYELDKLVNTVIDSKSTRYRFLFTFSYDTIEDNTRTFDELINAYLRVGNLPIALEYAARFSNKFSDSAMKNLLIRFDRYWRDYDNFTVYMEDLLKGEQICIIVTNFIFFPFPQLFDSL